MGLKPCDLKSIIQSKGQIAVALDTGRKLKAHKAFRRGPECLLNVL